MEPNNFTKLLGSPTAEEVLLDEARGRARPARRTPPPWGLDPAAQGPGPEPRVRGSSPADGAASSP